MDTFIENLLEKVCKIKLLFITVLLVTFLANISDAQPLRNNTYDVQSTYTMTVETGWNLLSLPLVVPDGSKTSLFPSAASDAFVYQNEYVYTDTLANGYGFWMKFYSAQNIVITGDTVLYDSIVVESGWNLIGSLTTPVAINMIRSDPQGIITSDFFYYSSEAGYQSTDTIQPGKGYWVKVNQYGSIILNGATGKACPGIPVVEYEGQTYNTVQIGNQCWLKENLDVGIRLDDSVGQVDNVIIEKYCYSNDTTYCNIYGGLYLWGEAMQYDTAEGAKGICPDGWHIPKLSEFDTLLANVNGDGNALKAVGQGNFDGIGTDLSGFSGLLTGYQHVNGGFFQFTDCTFFWSTTQTISLDVYCIALFASWGVPGRAGNPKGMGYSVRCLKD